MLQRLRKVRPPRRFVEEFCELHEKKMEKVERKRKTDWDLYDVEVVEVVRRENSFRGIESRIRFIYDK